jgi:molybdopterin converting factor subunit 1
MISVNVKFFGPLRDIVQHDEMTVELPSISTGESAFDSLSESYPELRKWKQSVRLAVNLEYVQFTHGLEAGDEVSFIPPVSGG